MLKEIHEQPKACLLYTSYLILALHGFLTLFPLYIMIVTSLKENKEIFHSPFALPSSFRWESYETVSYTHLDVYNRQGVRSTLLFFMITGGSVMVRKIIEIDRDKCNGCGLCARACHEGAICMVDGKAELLREDYCDGLGDCLPACPTGAITFVEREAAEYNHQAVMELSLIHI